MAGSWFGVAVSILAGLSLATIFLLPKITIDGDTLTMRDTGRTHSCSRDQITSVGYDGSSVTVRYRTADGREKRMTSSAAEGVLNLFGARLAHRVARSQIVAGELTDWWHGDPPSHS